MHKCTFLCKKENKITLHYVSIFKLKTCLKFYEFNPKSDFPLHARTLKSELENQKKNFNNIVARNILKAISFLNLTFSFLIYKFLFL